MPQGQHSLRWEKNVEPGEQTPVSSCDVTQPVGREVWLPAGADGDCPPALQTPGRISRAGAFSFPQVRDTLPTMQRPLQVLYIVFLFYSQYLSAQDDLDVGKFTPALCDGFSPAPLLPGWGETSGSLWVDWISGVIKG